MTLSTFSVSGVDMKSTGSYAIFTSSSTPFVITGITFIAEDVTGIVTIPSFSMGTNSPNFDNYLHIQRSSVNADNRYQYFSIGGTVNNLLPASSEFRINIVTPDSTSTANTQRVDITGYSL